MILNSGKYYIYRHIRLDKNEVFYIGIGTKKEKSTHKQCYYRAFRKANRNPHWNNIVNLNPNYKVEILLESDSLDFIIEKEIEFIELYKKTLCNKTSGGEVNKKVNKDSVKQIIEINKKIALQKRIVFEKEYKDEIIHDYLINKYSINKLYKKYKKYPKTINKIIDKYVKDKNNVCYKCQTYFVYNYLLDEIKEYYGNLQYICNLLKISYSSLYKMVNTNKKFKKKNYLVTIEKLNKEEYKNIYEKRAEN